VLVPDAAAGRSHPERIAIRGICDVVAYTSYVTNPTCDDRVWARVHRERSFALHCLSVEPTCTRPLGMARPSTVNPSYRTSTDNWG